VELELKIIYDDVLRYLEFRQQVKQAELDTQINAKLDELQKQKLAEEEKLAKEQREEEKKQKEKIDLLTAEKIMLEKTQASLEKKLAEEREEAKKIREEQEKLREEVKQSDEINAKLQAQQDVIKSDQNKGFNVRQNNMLKGEDEAPMTVLTDEERQKEEALQEKINKEKKKEQEGAKKLAEGEIKLNNLNESIDATEKNKKIGNDMLTNIAEKLSQAYEQYNEQSKGGKKGGKKRKEKGEKNEKEIKGTDGDTITKIIVGVIVALIGVLGVSIGNSK